MRRQDSASQPRRGWGVVATPHLRVVAAAGRGSRSTQTSRAGVLAARCNAGRMLCQDRRKLPQTRWFKAPMRSSVPLTQALLNTQPCMEEGLARRYDASYFVKSETSKTYKISGNSSFRRYEVHVKWDAPILFPRADVQPRWAQFTLGPHFGTSVTLCSNRKVWFGEF